MNETQTPYGALIDLETTIWKVNGLISLLCKTITHPEESNPNDMDDACCLAIDTKHELKQAFQKAFEICSPHLREVSLQTMDAEAAQMPARPVSRKGGRQ